MNELDQEVFKLRKAIKDFEKAYEDMRNNTDLFDLNIDERSYLIRLGIVNDRLYSSAILLNKVDKEIIADGILTKKKNGRYEINNIELSSGCNIEFIKKDEDGLEYYYPSRIEHNGEDYYILSLGKDVKIEGLKVRIRK